MKAKNKSNSTKKNKNEKIKKKMYKTKLWVGKMKTVWKARGPIKINKIKSSSSRGPADKLLGSKCYERGAAGVRAWGAGSPDDKRHIRKVATIPVSAVHRAQAEAAATQRVVLALIYYRHEETEREMYLLKYYPKANQSRVYILEMLKIKILLI